MSNDAIMFLLGLACGAILAYAFFKLGAGTVWRAMGKEGNPAEPPKQPPAIEQDVTE